MSCLFITYSHAPSILIATWSVGVIQRRAAQFFRHSIIPRLLPDLSYRCL